MLRTVRLTVLVTVALAALLASLPAGLWDDVTGFFGGLISDVGHVVTAVQRAVRQVIDWFGRLGQLADSAWDWMVNGVEWLGDRAVAVGAGVLHLATWLIERWVPMAAHWALGKAAALALGLYHTVSRWVTGLVNTVIRWVRGLVAELWSFIRGFWRTAWAAITKAANWIARATFYVFGLVAHPDRLAAWIAAHIIEPVVRWLVNAGQGVIRWLVRQTVSLLWDFAHVIERALAGLI